MNGGVSMRGVPGPYETLLSWQHLAAWQTAPKNQCPCGRQRYFR